MDLSLRIVEPTIQYDDGNKEYLNDGLKDGCCRVEAASGWKTYQWLVVVAVRVGAICDYWARRQSAKSKAVAGWLGDSML